jgi:hypothetical protein
MGGSSAQAGKSSTGGAAGASGGASSGSSNGGRAMGGSGSAGDAAQGGSTGGTSGASTAGGGPVSDLPDKIVAGYYPNWTPSPIRIKDVPAGYNVIYLFAAKPQGTTGVVTFADPQDGRGARTNLKADIQLARTSQGRKIILSVGGQGGGMSFPNRTKSETFIASIEEIYEHLGGIDGMDWNTFEADQAPDTDEMIWISLELKRRHPGFLISAPPAPWNQLDQEFCKTMVEAGAMDYAAPQYYDGPNLATQGYITQSVDAWVKLVGAEHFVVGFGIWDQDNYMAIDDAVATWKQLEQKHPTLRGAFDWQIHVDEANGWPFVNQIGPLVEQ